MSMFWDFVNLHDRLYSSVVNDDKDEFLRVVKDPEFQQLRHLCQDGTVLFKRDALNCAIAVLDGETKGLIDIEDGMTPLHLAAKALAPSLTKFLIERVGDNLNLDVCFENATLMAVEAIWVREEKGVFQLLFKLCHHNRCGLDVVRMLMQKTQNRERMRGAFMEYANQGKLTQFAALFLAAPEVFFSSVTRLYDELNSLDTRTDIQEELCLLLDVFAMVGDKLVAYIRLDEISEQYHMKTIQDIGLFISEVTSKKLGVSAPDYFLRFFKPWPPVTVDVQPSNNDGGVISWDWWINTVNDAEKLFLKLSALLKHKDFNKDDVYRRLPSLESEDAGHLHRSVEKKLSSMSTLQPCFEVPPGVNALSKQRAMLENITI